MDKQPKKYVVVLAHTDGWGALSANKVVRYLHEHYPGLGIHLIVSQATKDESGNIKTKLDDLKTPRELKETNLLTYFGHIDQRYEELEAKLPKGKDREALEQGKYPEGMSIEQTSDWAFQAGQAVASFYKPEFLTFKQLAKRCCSDGLVHYTSCGGTPGGKEAEKVVETLEAQYGHGPEIMLSVDTMAILPGSLLKKYRCVSAHPGPLDDIKVEGMQGTLRSLVHQVYYDANGKRRSKDYPFLGMGGDYIKGTLFFQGETLDQGPRITTATALVPVGMSAYQARDNLYGNLTDKMLQLLPRLLDKNEQAAMFDRAMRMKKRREDLPTTHVPNLEAKELEDWQGDAFGFPNEDSPTGVEVFQNQLIDPQYFKNAMRCFYPGEDEEFEKQFKAAFGSAVDRIIQQQDGRLEDPWARLLRGDKDITIRRYDPKTGEVIQEFRNL